MQHNGHERTVGLLIVEDDDDLRDTLCRYFRRAGLEVVGAEAAEAVPADVTTFDVAVCDINLPSESGFSLAAHLHQTTSIGIIMLTARGDTEDRLLGLSVGADDYLVKPVDLRELELRIRALARRVRAGDSATGVSENERRMATADPATWAFSRGSWRLLPPGQENGVALTAAEYHLLEQLMGCAGEPVDRGALLRALGTADLPDYSRNLDVAVSRLRRKVREHCGARLPVTSVRGVGYVFTAPVCLA